MNGVGAQFLRGGDDFSDVQINARGIAVELQSLAAQPQMRKPAVGAGEGAADFQPHPRGRASDTQRDFAAIGNE